ncbi:ubiquinone-dependent pyruvate dehydrogenase [Pseudoclavibacter sp. 13-3]|uniref:ubiquinone-dependent pyruvate dehydrogenase n=1 Tax=Pseudoclavibacter sp. 13-3 TaxID=2901228 RepID=UPI001E463E61|nr:ubiquinone-dependent pyruvate dehydrogenase [Pseudoclavibacter sp. 13-3]MCD7100919.1 ubiquinone-dependent pyruvate dehydrogenase [Pseudoclavibacter sp. 13-3]
MTTIAQNLIDTLEKNGVSRIYGVAGDSLNGITDAIRTSDGIDWVQVRHEESAAFAAGAESQLTGEISVCAGSCGPGNLHLINGLFDANRSRTPVLAIAAHIPSEEVGTGYFQETHPQELFRECSVYAELVSNAKQMPRLLEIAMRTAVERRGVAVLVIPGDVALTEALDSRVTRVVRTHPVVRPSDDELQHVASVLNGADRVTILAGAGVQGAHDELVQIADTLGAPVVHALRGKEFVEYDNPFSVGMTGLLGFASGYRAIDAADVLLMLGTDFPYPQFYPQDATVVQVDIRGEQLGHRTPLDIGLVGDVGDTVQALLPLLDRKQNRGHLEDALAHYKSTRAKLDELATPGRRDHGPLHPQYVAKVVDELAADDAVFLADVGSPVVWAARYLTMNGRRRLLGSFTHGSMANSVPQAIGAQSAHPDRQIVTFSGDGGLTMMLGDLLTLTQSKLPVKMVVFNNSSLNFVELEMKAAGFVNYGTGLENPNFADLATGAGIFGQRVEKPSELRPALEAAFAHDGPALIDVVTNRQELSMPPTVKAQQMKGFALYAIRTVMSGRGDELLDLAQTNWRQLF